MGEVQSASSEQPRENKELCHPSKAKTLQGTRHWGHVGRGAVAGRCTHFHVAKNPMQWFRMKQEVRFAREERCTCSIRASEAQAAPDHSPPDGEKREVLLVCALGGKQVELLGAALGGKERRTHHPKMLPRFLAHLARFRQ